tara:strand:+ start:453 stop:596 length:144 start_codon:yes stop_codon:yes gene_type:complete
MRIIDSLLYGIGELIWDAYVDFLIVALGLTVVVIVGAAAVYRMDKDD